MALAFIRSFIQWCFKCASGCRRKRQKSQTFETAEEVGELSSQECASTTAIVHTNQPSTGRSIQNQTSHQGSSNRVSIVSDISSENLTEFLELHLPIEELANTSNSEIIADTVPSVGCSVALTTSHVNQLESASKLTVTEPEVCSIVSPLIKQEGNIVCISQEVNSDCEQEVDSDCAQEVDSDCAQEVNSNCEQKLAEEKVRNCDQEVVQEVVRNCEQELAQEVVSNCEQELAQEVVSNCEQKLAQEKVNNCEQEVAQEVVSNCEQKLAEEKVNNCEQEVAQEVASDWEQEQVVVSLCERTVEQEVSNCKQEVFNHCGKEVSVIMAAVEQAQPSSEELQREATPEEDILNNGTGSMHASMESEELDDDFKLDSREDSPNIIEKQDTPEPEEVKIEQKPKERTKEERKSKRKEDKTIDHILRALSSLQTTEEKLAALCKKYADLLEDHRVLQSTSKQNQRKLSVVTREKDQLQSEHTKAIMAKSKLEGLCRELQKHNQVIRNESLQRAREEDEKRKEISNKFQTTITDIQQQMQEHHDRNMKLREENQELAGKLKKFIEQYEVREKQVEKVMQHREIEQKLADAKLQQASAILKEEQERNKKEKELLLLQLNEGTKKSTLLEAQLGMYKERYEEFQSTINKSNEMFQKFKSEMDKMAKRIKKLEKDGAQWKNKWENANRALLEMAEEKTLYDKEKPVLLGKIQKLESLCRAMQAERLGRKVLEASTLDPSKFEESVSSVQGSAGTEQKSKESEESSLTTPSAGEADKLKTSAGKSEKSSSLTAPSAGEAPTVTSSAGEADTLAPSAGEADTVAPCPSDSAEQDSPCDTEESDSSKEENTKEKVNGDPGSSSDTNQEEDSDTTDLNKESESTSQQESCQSEEQTTET